MDLAIGAKNVFVMMTLFDKAGRAKLVQHCTYPLTGVGCVSRIYTDVATFEVTPDGVGVTETYGITMAALGQRLDVLRA
jgi:3-oxoadipate CoA-transferase beta subunit